VGNAAIVGDSRKFASVIVSPDFQALERWAQQNGITTRDRKELVKDPKVQKQYESIVKKINVTLEAHEMVKRVRVVPDEWNVDSGELTPSLKLKRRVIVEKYKETIREIYGD
jgi:long-chain acyl-CoA synthetase